MFNEGSLMVWDKNCLKYSFLCVWEKNGYGVVPVVFREEEKGSRRTLCAVINNHWIQFDFT
jgi:hypothetical protein